MRWTETLGCHGTSDQVRRFCYCRGTETKSIMHVDVMLRQVSGTVTTVKPDGNIQSVTGSLRYRRKDSSTKPVAQGSPINKPRPVSDGYPADRPLVTGQHYLRYTFSLSRKGSTAAHYREDLEQEGTS